MYMIKHTQNINNILADKDSKISSKFEEGAETNYMKFKCGNYI